ncbi:RHS repeat-associated core domain-containing protein [Streptomyces sp. NPDC056227]|uniref:golvesin C-terminal-like domain-containing protein n=1 Tax=Streptomyces sp. NPDC056227 TaxID=3345753 RepID=UPI0035D55435
MRFRRHSRTTVRSTKFEYDQVGNRTKVITPRGVSTSDTEDFTHRTEYDKLNRPVKQFQPYDAADGRYNNPNVYTQTVYDEVGRVARTSLPPSEGQTVRNDTDYTYYDNGWAKTATDPWDILTEYDYTDLGRQKSRKLTSAGGDASRTMGWSYYPDGSLQARSDDGVPVGAAVVVADNSDTQATGSTGTWATGSITGQQGYNHRTHAAGSGTDAFTWNLNIPQDGTYTVHAKFPKVTGAATAAKYTVVHEGTPTDKTVDQNLNTGTWVSLGSYAFKRGNTDKVQLFQNGAGTVVADAVKVVRTVTEADTEKKDSTYSYDVNGNLTQLTDGSSNAKIDAYRLNYTGLNQLAKMEELLTGTVKKATTFAYDANGLLETVAHPDQHSAYTYDLRDLVKTVKVGKSETDTDAKTTAYTYTDRRQLLRETKANGNTADYVYFLNGAIKTQTEKKANGTLVSSHTYAYDANGNKAQDVAKKMNADDHAAYLSSTTDYTYDPVDRLKQTVKTGNGASTDSYVHDDNANVIRQTVKNVTSEFTYDRNRLLSSVTSTTSASYNYDAYGRLDTVTSDGKVLEDSDYDGFDHVVKHSKLQGDGSTKTATYVFDPLDRTASKTEGGKTTDYNYLGTSKEVLDEAVAGQVTKSFQYSPWGERLSQVKKNADGTEELGVYGYNSHTDTETLTDATGDTKATYGYTAYGDDDDSKFTGIDKPEAANPDKEAYNPYRFNAKRWDAASGTYDMGFRDYNPGLNRFTTRDMYGGALADMGLGADPFTGNRYAFTGGNPITRIELDGHRTDDGGGQTCASACTHEEMQEYRLGVAATLAATGDLSGAAEYSELIYKEAEKYIYSQMVINQSTRRFETIARNIKASEAHFAKGEDVRGRSLQFVALGLWGGQRREQLRVGSQADPP